MPVSLAPAAPTPPPAPSRFQRRAHPAPSCHRATLADVHKLHYLRRTWSCAPPMPPLSMRPGRKGKQQQQQQQQQQHDDDGGSLVYNKEGGGLVRKRKDSDKSNVPPPQLGRPYGSGAAGAPPPLPDLSPTATGAAAKPGSAKKARAPSPSAGLERFVTGKPHASTMVRAAPAAGRGAGGGKRPKSEMAAAAAAVVAAAANQAAGGEAPQPALLSFQQGGLAPSPSKPPPLADEWPAHLAVIGATGVSDEDATPMEEDGAAGAPRGGASASPGARATASAEGSPAQVFGGGDVDKASVEAVADVLIFRLVRDAIASLPQALAPAEYVRKQVHSMADAQGMGAKLPKGSPLGQYIRSALAFLCMTAEEHAARTQRAASLPRAQQLPLVGFDEMSQSYRWLGSKEASADAMLLPLDAIHFERFCAGHPAHGGGLGTHGMRSANHGPKGGKGAGVITLPAGSAEQLAALRKQEIERYGNPDQPYKYMLRDGSVSAVAPLGKKSAGGKARDHFLLVSERPSAVTLLSLVRDAAARLPGGEGSRADVCELLKESQFVNDGVSDVQISQVVSGALDRLHQENDACVRYDSERKLWAYLHASRTVDDFLARSQQHRAALIAVAGPPKEITPPATPSAPPPQQETPESEPSPPQAAEPLPAGFSHLPMAHPGRPHG